jgi:hypothetical protein
MKLACESQSPANANHTKKPSSCTCAFAEEQTYTQMSENPKNLENYRSAWQQEENNLEKKHTYL